MMYRKKPVIIEAKLFTEFNYRDLAEWCDGVVRARDDNFEPYINIYTLEGTMTASLGDYIIKGTQGEFYACKPDIFELTYEKVEE
jgi:hypothetical protein